MARELKEKDKAKHQKRIHFNMLKGKFLKNVLGGHRDGELRRILDCFREKAFVTFSGDEEPSNDDWDADSVL